MAGRAGSLRQIELLLRSHVLELADVLVALDIFL
jgi:hypothetical protein